MKRIQLLVYLMFSFTTVLNAQNPFQELGVKCEMLTLSKGKFCEFFPNDSIVRIGTVIFNTYTNQVIDILVVDSTNENDLRLQPYITSRWISIDPLAEKYSQWSPYNFCKGNPIVRIDPDGQDDILILNGDKKQATTDIYSILPADYKNGISVNENTGVVVLNPNFDWSNSDDPGVNLINNMCNSNNVYEYNVADNVTTREGDNKTGNVCEDAKLVQNNLASGVGNNQLINASKTIKKPGSDYYYDMPLNSLVDGQVTIAKQTDKLLEFGSKTQLKNRPSTVLHELFENFSRTEIGLPYTKAHAGSILIEMGLSQFDPRRDYGC